MRIDSSQTQKEETYQVMLDIIKNSNWYNTFLITADVSKIYMQQFWYTVKKIKNTNSYEFDLADKKCKVDVKGMFHKKNVDFVELIWEDFQYQIDFRKSKLRRREIMPYHRFTELIINHFLSQNKSLAKQKHLYINIIKDDDVLSRLKFIRTGEDFQEYGQAILDTMLTEEIKQSENYQTFLSLSTGLIPLKKTREKPASEEDSNEPANRPTGRRRTSGIVFRDTSWVSKKKSLDHSQKLKGIQVLTEEEQLAADTMQAIKGRNMVPDESTIIFTTSSEGTGITPGVPDEVKGSSKAKVDSAINWGSENKSDYFDEAQVDEEEIKWVSTDEEEEKQDDQDDDDDDDRSLDIKETDDDEKINDKFVHGDEYVHDDMDEEMKDAKDDETGKDDEEITDAEKTEATKDDYEQAGKLPPTSFSLPVSSSFGNQFLNLSSDISLIVSVIPEQTTPTPSTALPTETPVSMVHLPPPIVSEISFDVNELKQVDNSSSILATIRSQVPPVVNEYLGSSLRDALQKIKQEHVAKEKMPKFLTTLYDQAAEAEFKQKEILFKMIRESKSYEKHLTQKALKRKRSSGKDYEPSKTSSASKETSKGDTPPKSFKISKYASAEESVKEATHDVTMDDEELVQENVIDADQPQDNAEPHTNNASKKNWFKQPLRPPTPDPEWNNCQVVDGQPEQTWFNDLVSGQKDPLTFDELMATPIDFFKFAKNHLKLDKITKADLVGPVYNLLKGMCDRCPFELSKPLPLKGHPGHLTVPLEYFFNNDLEYLKSTDPERKYTNSITKTKAVRYELVGIEDMTPPQWSVTKVGYDKDAKRVNKLHDYGYLEEIVVRRADHQLYKFKEGDFVNLHLNDVKDIILLVVQHKLFHLDGELIVDLAVALRMFTRSLIIKKTVEDVQLGVESYQKKLNITKPQKDFLGIFAKEPYTPSYDPPGVVYEDLSNQKRLMQFDEIYKFSDIMLKKVHDTLYHRLLNF
ncbi:hypothetical protein Tco_1343800 [Tanacetum coccineum]